MARRTKEDALITRNNLLDAAEKLFQLNGVSGTSLHDIAREAGATRGAVYWHFKDKADLFNAMMERVTLPLEQAFKNPADDSHTNPLSRIRHALGVAFAQIANDPHTRRVFEVATQKVEYVDELQAVRARHLKVRNEFIQQMEDGLRDAASAQELVVSIPFEHAARGLHALADGLIQNWLLDTAAFELTASGRELTRVYLSGLGFK
ncbi:MAG: transcriptional regulator, TetR family [Polaromonas sp.]|nr:transcriptional regulator, TetR family [Polaromonas sp.]